MSHLFVYPSLLRISGATYPGVPHFMYRCPLLEEAANVAIPKSASFTLQSPSSLLLINMLSSLISLWTIDFWWIKSRVSRSYSIMMRTCNSFILYCLNISLRREPSAWYSKTRYIKLSSSYISSKCNTPPHSSSAQWTFISYNKFVIPYSCRESPFLSRIFMATGVEGLVRSLAFFIFSEARNTLPVAPSPTIF